MTKIRVSIVLILSAILFSCSSKLQVTSDYDAKADFKSFKTFMFLPWDPGSSEYIGPNAQKRLFDQLEKELNAMGYQKVTTEADLAVNVLVLLDEKRDAINYTRYYSTGGYSYYYPFGFGLNSSTYYKKVDYLQGTMIVDMFNQKERLLIWQGVVTLEVVENQKKRQQSVMVSLKKLFKNFPAQS